MLFCIRDVTTSCPWPINGCSAESFVLVLNLGTRWIFTLRPFYLHADWTGDWVVPISSRALGSKGDDTASTDIY